MYLLGKRADKVNEDDIKRLVQNRMQENKSLDYKKELRLTQDKDKKEFLFDVTSLANTEGGCLVYGIEESKDEKGQNTGTPDTIIGIDVDNNDKLAQQIEDIIRGNTEPSISNIALNHLVVDGRSILVVGISKTLGLPTMVTFNETNKFYRRRNSGKYSVDVYELNQMFMQNQVLKESAEKFRLQRIEKVRSGKVFPNLDAKTSFFIHIIPFGFQNEQNIDITNSEEIGLFKNMKPMFLSGWDSMYNVDGYATWNGMRDDKITSYNQLFRNGIYEAYTSRLFHEYPIGGQKQLRMDGEWFIKTVEEQLTNGLIVLKKKQIEPPFIISLSVIGIKDAVIANRYDWSKPFLVDEIYLPPVVFPVFECDILQYLKPNFDILWQSVSQRQSPEYRIA